MVSVRKAAVAGLFYPEDPNELRETIERLLAAGVVAARTLPPKAVIAPHAGYVYSGAIAASAFAPWLPLRGKVKRVVVLGPSHFVILDGFAITTVSGFETPLGTVPIDKEGVNRIRGLPQVQVLNAAHAREHSIEVILPFLQVVLGDFALVPVAVGEAQPEDVADLLAALWGGPETRIVVSSDLSHYYAYDEARKIDGRTRAAIEHLEIDKIGAAQACGSQPIRGLLALARRRGLGVKALDTRNSGDTAGNRGRVVGYGAFAVADEGAALQ